MTCRRGARCESAHAGVSPEFRKGKTTCRACESADRAARGRAEPDLTRLTSCLEWGSDIQRAAVEAFAKHGSIAAAAEALGLSARALHGHLQELERRAARSGWSPGNDMVKPVPAGFHVKGVSTLYGADGSVRGQWVKSNKDHESKLEALLDAVATIAEPFRGAAEPAPAPAASEQDLLVVYPIGDPHFGMQSWAAETGEDFDLKIAEADLLSAVDHLVSVAPPARTAIVASLGDAFHADSKRNTTTAGTPVDVDTRWSKTFGVVVRAMRRCIDRALEKHEIVRVVCVTGNHDEHLSLVLAHCLAQFYERDPRVQVDTSPGAFFWHRHGKCLLGFHHGDKTRRERLPGVMACDRRGDWGETLHRRWYIGHVHHESVTEYPGVTVESFRTLAPKDAWHASSGYRSGQDMKADIWHAEHGLIARHSIGIAQVRGRRPR